MTKVENLSKEFSKPITSLRLARTTARQSIQARASKKCQTKPTLKTFLISKNTQRVYIRLCFIGKEKSHSTFKSTRVIILYFTSLLETKSPINWIHQRIGPQTTALSFYFHCFKQLLTNAEDCVDLYKKSVLQKH